MGRQLISACREAWLALRMRRRRVLLSAVGIALAAAMLSAAIVIAEGLGRGFTRAARTAQMGDLIVRFDPVPAREASQRIRALPDVAGFALRMEIRNVPISYAGHETTGGVGEILSPRARQGYAVVAGHNLGRSQRGVLIEPGLASAWHIHLGARISLGVAGTQRVVGLVEGPDDVGFPLGAARFYIRRSTLEVPGRRYPSPPVDFAEVWLRNPRYVNEVLVQARSESFGLRHLQFATRGGVQVLVNQAAGIVIDLLVALSVIALATAAVLLAASARAEVQRRMRAIGISRAVGATRGHVAAVQALETTIVTVPAATIGVLAGLLATYSPDDRLLALLNEPGPGAGLAQPLLLGWLASIALPVAGAAWPAWSAAGRAVIALLRGADVGSGGRRRRRSRRRSRRSRGGGLAGLGARLVAARRARLLATVTMLASSTAFVLLMLALAGALSSLETDPQELGKHYQITASAPPTAAARIARAPGVLAAEPRYEVHAVDEYALGELVDVIAYPLDHTLFEAPPLASGGRLHGNHEAEVGVGLANALGLAPRSELLLELPSGKQLRLRVSGTVSSLEDEGLVAYVPASALLTADPSVPSQVAVLLRPGANQSTVFGELARMGADPQTTEGATARGAPLVAVLKTILRAIAIVDGLVCIYALVQACALTMQERRRTVAVLRACGGGGSAIRRLLLGTVLALVLPAAIAGIALERFLFGPALAHLAAGYASLDLTPTLTEVVAILAGLAVAGGASILWVSRAATRESVVAGLAG
ncbi:MAG TPA: FtsX-like permease family protein [Solirubrobacteraceae bacterium]|jgi:ABC-type lipoprotein release transport system permease subunit|nr:FtsX-like permease family protein [Solirubrobacteraceae bacterium]